MNTSPYAGDVVTLIVAFGVPLLIGAAILGVVFAVKAWVKWRDTKRGKP